MCPCSAVATSLQHSTVLYSCFLSCTTGYRKAFTECVLVLLGPLASPFLLGLPPALPTALGRGRFDHVPAFAFREVSSVGIGIRSG